MDNELRDNIVNLNVLLKDVKQASLLWGAF